MAGASPWKCVVVVVVTPSVETPSPPAYLYLLVDVQKPFGAPADAGTAARVAVFYMARRVPPPMLKVASGLAIDVLTTPVPGLLHHAHCSGIVAYPDGELVAVYYHAINEANRKQAIYLVRKRPGEAWTAPVKIIDDPWRMVGNPAIWVAPGTGKTFIFFVRSIGGWAACNPRFATSEDRGVTWSRSKALYSFISRGIKNPPIVTSTGRYVLPAYIEFRDYFSLFYLSDDQGKTWREVGRVKIPDDEVPDLPMKRKWGRLVLQPTVVERKDGSLWALMRAKRPLGKMYQTESRDGGETWSPAKPYHLPNPGAGFHVSRLQSGNLAVIYNHAPVPSASHAFERNPLSVAISDDDGATWKWRRNLLEEPDNPGQRIGGYPTMTQAADGTIHATWSFAHEIDGPGGERIKVTDIHHTSFTEAWVKEHPFFDGPWELP